MNFLKTEETERENFLRERERERRGEEERESQRKREEEESNPAPGKNSFPEENLLEIETSSLLL